MGSVGSKIYSHGRRLVIRYNAENRAHKFLDKGNLPTAPRHEQKKLKEVQLSRDALEDIHCKNEKLNEYLKKVYLTSTSKITGTPSTRPKPKKENEALKKFTFYEPENPLPGCCTLTNAVDILVKFNSDPEKWSVNILSQKFNLDKKDVVNFVTYYALYRLEHFEFMNQTEQEDQKINYEALSQIQKKSVRHIDSK